MRLTSSTRKRVKRGLARRSTPQCNRTKMKTGFAPISFKEYVEIHLKRNSGTSRKEVTEVLEDTLRAYKQGARCDCGNPINVPADELQHRHAGISESVAPSLATPIP